jgi:hypothetical protein
MTAGMRNSLDVIHWGQFLAPVNFSRQSGLTDGRVVRLELWRDDSATVPRGKPLSAAPMKPTMSIDPVESSAREPVTSTGPAENILPWIAQIATILRHLTDYFLRPFSDRSRGRVDHVAGDAGARTETVRISKQSITTKTIAEQLSAEIQVNSTVQTNRVVDSVPDQQEIERRRDLVRALFNDFWRGSYDKPAAFVDRLDQAEAYLNERLAALGEVWHLDTKTRALLGLPPRSKSSNQPKDDLMAQCVAQMQRSQPS